MPVALADLLADNALVSLDEAKAYCGITRPTVAEDLDPEDQRLVEAINAVSAFVETDVRPMRRKVETLRLPPPRGPVLKLLRIPLDPLEPVELAVNDAVKTVWRSEADGPRGTFDALVHRSVPSSRWTPDGLVVRGVGGAHAHWLYCGDGCTGWGIGVDPEPILLTYTGGWDCIPEDGSPNKLPGDVLVAVKDSVRAWFRNQQQGTSDVVSIAQPGGGPTFEIPRWMPYGAGQLLARHRPVAVLG
jgi:hypothetical protein